MKIGGRVSRTSLFWQTAQHSDMDVLRLINFSQRLKAVVFFPNHAQVRRIVHTPYRWFVKMKKKGMSTNSFCWTEGTSSYDGGLDHPSRRDHPQAGGTSATPCLCNSTMTLSTEGGFRPRGSGSHGFDKTSPIAASMLSLDWKDSKREKIAAPYVSMTVSFG